MTDLPNPFNSGATPGPDEAAALTRSHAPGAAADLPVSPGAIFRSLPSGESEPSVMLACAPGESKQRLLEAIEDDYRFVLDEEKFLFDIGCVPEDFAKYMAMMEGLVDHDEPPLFIQEQKRA